MNIGGSLAKAKARAIREKANVGTLGVVVGKGETADGMRTHTGTTVMDGNHGAVVKRIATPQAGGKATGQEGQMAEIVVDQTLKHKPPERVAGVTYTWTHPEVGCIW